jgi:pyruvate dehydrogenase E2 component (dihydrolipoamide acetyltransferase)
MSGEVTMPRLGQDMTEGVILEWVKDPGDRVEAGETLAVIQTDKVEVEFEAPTSGWLREILVPAGETAAVATRIAWITDTPDEPLPTAAPARVPASPRARAEARRLGVDLSSVTPTGPNGWVTEADVLRAAAAGVVDSVEHPPPGSATLPLRGAEPGAGTVAAAPAGQAPAAARGQQEAASGQREAAPAPREAVAEAGEPVTAMRRAIAARMTRAAAIPQFRVTRECELGGGAGGHLRAMGVGWTDLIVWATARALRRHPEVNASFVDGPAPAIVRHRRVAVGLAVAVPGGLVVPALDDADTLDLPGVHAARRRLEDAARSGTLRPEQVQGATFTVSSLGGMGVDQFDALLNPPEAGILAVGRVADRPVAVAGEVRVATTVRLTFTGDHRALDGAAGAGFLATLAGLLAQDPPGTGG